jgi:hypothetical protein
MQWSIVDITKLSKLLQVPFLRKPRTLALVSSAVAPIQLIYGETLYKMQHDGRTIYLEKVLNEWFSIVGYNTQDHENTKLVYIDDVAAEDKLYIHQDLETEVEYLEDDDSEEDIFLEAENESSALGYSFIIFIPDTLVFDELKVRALVDSYRYFGKKYIIQTYSI